MNTSQDNDDDLIPPLELIIKTRSVSDILRVTTCTVMSYSAAGTDQCMIIIVLVFHRWPDCTGINWNCEPIL